VDVNHAKEVAVGIFQDNEVVAWFVSPGIPSGSEADQPSYFRVLVLSIKIEM
jgi:hypothetical protein